jgi:hypothetical protein
MSRNTWARKHHAANLDRAERLEKAIADTQRAESLTIQFVDQLTNEKLIREAEAKERAAAAALKEETG